MSFRDRYRKGPKRTKGSGDGAAKPPCEKAVPSPQMATNVVPIGNSIAKKEPQAESVFRSGAVQRIRLGRHLLDADPKEYVDPTHGTPFLMGLGRIPTGARGSLGVVRKDGEVGRDDGDDLYPRLSDAMPILNRHSLPIGQGPYADDPAGTLAGFNEALFDGIGSGASLSAHMVRVIEALQGSFHFDNTFVAPPDYDNAAGPISSPERAYQDEVTGLTLSRLVHPLEYSRLAAACLRRRGFNAYPAFGILPHPEIGEVQIPVMAFLDLSGKSLAPLHISSLDGSFPRVGAVDLLSDQAMMGFARLMEAEATLKYLSQQMLALAFENRQLPGEEAFRSLERVASALFESYKRWPDVDAGAMRDGSRDLLKRNHTLQRSLLSMKDVLFDAIERVHTVLMQANWGAIAAQNPMMQEPGSADAALRQIVSQEFEAYFNQLQHLYLKLIAEAKAAEGKKA